jgi:NitT/TauT family transport system substrate-binding protein
VGALDGKVAIVTGAARKVLAALSVLVAMCLPLMPASAQAPPFVLRLGAAANETYAEAYYAQDMGFFRDAGLNVEITTMVSGAAIMAGVMGGALDIGGAGLSAIANGHLRGLPVFLVAPGGVYSTTSPTSGLIVAKTSQIRKPADFVGKTIAVTTLRDAAQVALMSWIDQNGGDSGKVQFIEMPAAEMGAAVGAGRIDGAFTPEPNLTQAMSDARLFGHAYDGIAPRFLTIGWFSSKAFLDAHLDVAQKFNAVMRRTATWAQKNPERSAEILAKYSKLPVDLIQATHRTTYSQTLDPKLVQPVIDVSVHYKALPSAFPATELFYPGLR